MSDILWEKTLKEKYLCKCVKVNDFVGKLTVTDTVNNNVLLEKETVLIEPYNYSLWENMCQSAINQST